MMGVKESDVFICYVNNGKGLRAIDYDKKKIQPLEVD